MKLTNCPKCNGTGLLPFILPNGTVSKYAKIFCECHEDDYNHYRTPTPEDIDFACSYDFRSYFQEMATGRSLPSLEPRDAPPEPQPLPTILPEHKLSQKVKEMEGILNNTRMKILEHIVLSKKRKYKRYE